MNILFVNNFYNLFAKADCGASQRSMCLIRALAKIGHVDVVSFVDETVSDEPNVDVVFSEIVEKEAHTENRLDKFFKLFCKRNPYAVYPINIQKSKIIDSFVANKKYDYIVIRYLYYACECGLLKYANQLILDIDDDPKEVVLMSLDKTKTWRNKQYNRLFANTVNRITRYVLEKVFRGFYSSPNKVYPNAVFLPNVSSFCVSSLDVDLPKNPHKLLVVGKYSYYPNVEGLERFIISVFPMIRKQIQDAELDVVGKMNDGELRSLCESTAGVNLRGFVEDIKNAYAGCGCVIVPLYKGTGTSVKLVEALACGKAVVTTPVGMRGLHPDFQEGVDYLLADSDEEFAHYVVRLLTDVEMNEKMVRSAFGKTRLHYSEEAFSEIVSSTLCSRH